MSDEAPLAANVVLLGTPPVLALLAHAAAEDRDRELWDAVDLDHDLDDFDRAERLRNLALEDEDGNLTGLGESAAGLLRALLGAGAVLMRPPPPCTCDGPSRPTG